MHAYACMVNITIREVSQSTRDQLAARARARGQSMQEYLRSALDDLANRADQAEVWARIRADVAREGTMFTPDEILEAVREGRKE